LLASELHRWLPRQLPGKARSRPGTAPAAEEVTVPDSGGRFLRARLRARPVTGGLLPVHRSDVTADVVAGITLAAVSIPVALGYAKIAEEVIGD